MKNKIRFLAVLLGMILALTPLATLGIGAVDGASAAGSSENTAATKKLAITEINGANVDNTGYQYVEVLNVSKEPIDLADYYLYRYVAHDNKDYYDKLLIEYMLAYDTGKYANHNIARIRIGDYVDGSAVLNSGELAVLWLDTTALAYNGTHKVKATCTDANGNGTAGELADFKAYWNVADDVKVLDIKFTYNGFYAFHAAHALQEAVAHNYDSYNTGFLPLAPGNAIIQLTHKDAEFTGITNEKGNTATPATDLYDFDFAYYVNGYTGCYAGGVTSKDIKLYEANTRARFEAAECSAMWNTEFFDYAGSGTKPSGAPTASTAVRKPAAQNVQHFYSFMNMDKYAEDGAALGTIVTKNLDKYTSFVTGKLDENGDYKNGFGLQDYYDLGDSTPLYWADEGTAAPASPGKLENGQFGYNAVSVVGYQKSNTGNSLRILATFEADAMTSKRLGFEISATYSDGGETVTKSIKKDCYNVYTSVLANGEAKTVSEYNAVNGRNDEYFFAISVSGVFDGIEFTVKPYVVNEFGVTCYGDTVSFNYQAQ